MTEPSLSDVISEAIETLTAFSVPLYSDDAGRPLLRGTGFFVNVGSECFLISAAHVLDQAMAEGMYVYSAPRQKRYLQGRVVRSGTPENRSTDIVDIGVLKLSGIGRPPFAEVRKFAMDVSYLKPHRLPRAGREYVIVGFPATKNQFRVRHKDMLAVPYAYRSDSIPEVEYRKNGVSPESHVLLPLDLRRGFDAAGRPTHFPRPQGMSGAPVVVLFEGESEARVFPVVAVGIEYRKAERILVASDVRFVLEAIRRAA